MFKVPIFENPTLFNLFYEDYSETMGTTKILSSAELKMLPHEYAVSMVQHELNVKNLRTVLEAKMNRFLDILLNELTDDDGEIREHLLTLYLSSPEKLNLNELPALKILNQLYVVASENKIGRATRHQNNPNLNSVARYRAGNTFVTDESHKIFRALENSDFGKKQALKRKEEEEEIFSESLATLLSESVVEPYRRALIDPYDRDSAWKELVAFEIILELEVYFFFSKVVNLYFPAEQAGV